MGVDTAALAAVSGWRAAMAAATAACKGAPPSSSLSVHSFVVELEHSVEAEFSEKSSPKKGQPPSPPSSMLAATFAEYGAAALLSPPSLETFASLLPTSSSSSSSSSSALAQASAGSKVTAPPSDGIVPDSAALLTGGGGGRRASLGSGTIAPSTSPAGLLRCVGAGGSPMAFFAKPRGPIMLLLLQALPPAVGTAAALAVDEPPVANARLLCCSLRPP